MHELTRGEVWGGTSSGEGDITSVGMVAAVYAASCNGGRGGDVYYLSLSEDGASTRFAVADVVGHGEAASLMGQWLYESFRERINNPNARGVLKDINALACARGVGAMSTGIVGAVHRPELRLTFVCAGHPRPLLWRKHLGVWSGVDEDMQTVGPWVNLPLGVLADAVYVQKELELERGDRLCIYTDGLTEIRNRQGTQFGRDRLCCVLNDVSHISLPDMRAAILHAIAAHAGDCDAHDDMTLLLLEIR